YVGEQAVELLRQPRDAVQADNLQRAVRLVEVRLRESDLVRGGRIGGVFAQAPERALQCLLDLALDPSERADIKVGRPAHAPRGCACLWLCCDSAPCQTILKFATDPLSSCASFAIWPTETAVCFVPSVVCLVTDRMSCIVVATCPAACACACEVTEI